VALSTILTVINIFAIQGLRTVSLGNRKGDGSQPLAGEDSMWVITREHHLEIDWLIDWCLTPILAMFQLHVNQFDVNLDPFENWKLIGNRKLNWDCTSDADYLNILDDCWNFLFILYTYLSGRPLTTKHH
jgi:hypothetical protein